MGATVSAEAVPSTGTLPDISATTPKVSLFKFTSMGPELIAACVKQATDPEFSDIADTKLKFMQINAKNKINQLQGSVIRNATGVRLSRVDLPSISLSVDYPPPAVIEPGECASFLNVLNSGPQGLVQYEAQVFEGPFAGWLAPTGDILKIPVFKINVGSDPVSPSTAKARVQDKAGGAPTVVSTLTWTSKFTPSAEGSVFQYTLTQSLD